MVSPSSEKFYTVRRSRSIQSTCFLKVRQHAKIYTSPRILTLDGLIKLYWESESTSRHLPRRSEAVSTSKVSNCSYRQSRRKSLRFGLSTERNDFRLKQFRFWHILNRYIVKLSFQGLCLIEHDILAFQSALHVLFIKLLFMQRPNSLYLQINIMSFNLFYDSLYEWLGNPPLRRNVNSLPICLQNIILNPFPYIKIKRPFLREPWIMFQ